MELAVVSAVRPKVDDLTAALKSADRQASLDALEAYDAGWNGVEVYINVRSKELYDKLEGDLQHQLEEGLAAASPDFPALAKVSEQLGTEFDKAVAMAKDGPAISPLFDDVTRLRMIRADLRIANAALAAGDVAKARTYFEKFAAGFDAAVDLIKVRSADAYAAAEAAFDKVKDAFAANGATAETLTPLAAALTSRYNFGVGLWNAAARNHDMSKTTWTDADLAALATLARVEEEVGQAVKFSASGDYVSAKAEIDEAIEHFADVQAALAAHNGADVTPPDRPHQLRRADRPRRRQGEGRDGGPDGPRCPARRTAGARRALVDRARPPGEDLGARRHGAGWLACGGCDRPDDRLRQHRQGLRERGDGRGDRGRAQRGGDPECRPVGRRDRGVPPVSR